MSINIFSELLNFSFFVILLALFIGIFYYHYWNRYRRFPTFDEYKKENPDCAKGGKIKCHSCSGTHIQFKGLSNATDRRKTHYCVTCGSPLYRSYH
ncbi:cbb3-type cytochrome oxidase subunit 3 [Thiopseudomonas alkaliphila]|uniref:cbb3-type cytochrome oxidase subunit 3 n=1 Tax=Thiopseudomonas alkaliphila TaxID=1697053 RepID=UPI0011DD520A|nr:cbb3-type cytochrome c oxidase subunit 3 [Thiopseudomonas alkaliphila]